MLSHEKIRKIFDKVDRELEEEREKRAEERRRELKDMGIEPIKTPKERIDHPNTIEESTATFFWVVSLIVGALFKDAWMIWIFSTIIWYKFITRHDK